MIMKLYLLETYDYGENIEIIGIYNDLDLLMQKARSLHPFKRLELRLEELHIVELLDDGTTTNLFFVTEHSLNNQEVDIKALRQELRVLELQRAKYGIITPPHIVNRIDEIKKELQIVEEPAPSQPRAFIQSGADKEREHVCMLIETKSRFLRILEQQIRDQGGTNRAPAHLLLQEEDLKQELFNLRGRLQQEF